MLREDAILRIPVGVGRPRLGIHMLDESEQLGTIDRHGHVSGRISHRDRGPQLVEGGRTGRAGPGLVDPAGEPDWCIVVGERVHSVDEHGGRARESIIDGPFVSFRCAGIRCISAPSRGGYCS